MRHRFIIAVDGPSGVGKSSICKILARKIGFSYIDTGAMYRAVALKAYKEGIAPEDEKRLSEFCSGLKMEIDGGNIVVNGEDITEEIRKPLVDRIVSGFAARKVVRDLLLALQRKLGGKGNKIMEGRDIGTVVFSEADLKFYLDARDEVRAERRYKQLKENGFDVSLGDIVREIRERDYKDSTRHHSPLKMAGDAVYIDTSEISKKKVMEIMLNRIKEISVCGNICR